MRGPCLISGLLLLAGAAALAPGRPSLPAQARDLVRPLVLPMLWKGMESARRDGTPEEYTARGRVLMRLLPHWTDGHVHIAGRLAFDASLAQTETAAALDRLMAALSYLAEVRAESDARGDARAVETLLETQARFLYIRCQKDPGIAAAFQERNGVSPTSWAVGYLRQIPRLSHSSFLRAELCFTIIEGLEIDIRLEEPVDRLLASIDSALLLLGDVSDANLATEWRAALEKVRSHLVHPDEETRRRIANDPKLDRIDAALRARGDRPRRASK